MEPEWELDDDPCDGPVGRDALSFLREHGSLVGYRQDVSTAFSLRGRDYRRADLSSSDFSRGGLQGVRFGCASFRLATLTGHFALCDFRRANFRGATFRGAYLEACDFRRADLRDTDMRFARFETRQVGGGRHGCNLDNALLVGADLRGATFRAETIWPSDFDPEQHGAVAAPM